ncbi:hypothetical protein GGR58DRAFT_79042 [Xylaria digitata]|nr:hypothetical protein GGR58DRAFT_79042 [Xylaria digitata]
MLLSSVLLGGKRDRGQEDPNAAEGGGQQPLGPRGAIVRAIASGIGLAAETYHHHKEKNIQEAKERGGDLPLTSQVETPKGLDTQPTTLSQQVDEAAWQLDDAQQQVMQQEVPPYTSGENQVSQLAETFLQRHSIPPTLESETPQLALPVVITQRRPGKRERGFIRAYAPVLNNVGISEATFLEFIDNMNKAIMPSPWIQALNLASLAGIAVPLPFSVLISVAVQQATNVASAAHSRFKTNQFLNQVNKSFFMPRGLIAVIMTWKPSQPGEILTNVNFDMVPEITAAVNESKQSSLRKKFAQSSGAALFEWPETAPLVFPVLDNIGAADTQKKQNALKRAGVFVTEYMDSRSRAKWAGQNPDSTMANAGPKEQFHSRYSDPNHPASSGDPVALLTGGHFQSFLAGGRRGAFPGRIGRGGHDPSNGPSGLIVGHGGVVELGSNAVRKIFEKDILYLMIVQLPTPEQIAEAAAFVPIAELRNSGL